MQNTTTETTETQLWGHERVGKYTAHLTHADHLGADPLYLDIPDFDTEDEARTYALTEASRHPRANRVLVNRIERDTFTRGLYEETVNQIELADAAWNEQRETEETAGEDEEPAAPAIQRRARRTAARTRRQIIRQRTRTNRAAAKIRRQDVGTLATHCVAAGLGIREARTVASSLRKNATKAGVTGTPSVSYTHGRARHCTRYTPREVVAIVALYRPRKPAYRLAAAKLALAA